jgi:FtsH-binding integral membrane protein
MSNEREVRLRFILIFVMLYGCILFLIRPHPTTAQTIFRFALIAVGIAGLVWMQVRSRRQ